MYYTVIPAYGRDYKSRAAVIADWEGGKDFLMQPQGCYCSVRDFRPGDTVNIRYKKFECSERNPNRSPPMKKTYAKHNSQPITYRGYTITVLTNESTYLRTSGKAYRWLWNVAHPTIAGRGMRSATLEVAKQTVDDILSGCVGW